METLIDLEGNLNINVRLDKRRLAALNVPGAFIGKTSQKLAKLWNEKYPSKQVALE